MKKTYIVVQVYNDGDNELTRLELDSAGVSKKHFDGCLCFDTNTEIDKLTKELLDYGNDPADIREAIMYSLNNPLGIPCIVGKV